MDIRDILRDWLKTNGVTQMQFAADIRVHPTTLSQYIHGRCRPDLEVLYRMCERTGISADQLLAACLKAPPLVATSRKKRTARNARVMT